jgi:hypothetical protein
MWDISKVWNRDPKFKILHLGLKWLILNFNTSLVADKI